MELSGHLPAAQCGYRRLAAGDIRFPNAFTPSNSGPTDGVYDPRSFDNDYFFPLYEGVEDYKLGDLQPLGRTAVRDRGRQDRLGWLLPWPTRQTGCLRLESLRQVQ